MDMRSWKKQMNETFRGQTLLKYYKEDLVNVLREFYTMEQLQEVLKIDERDAENLISILRTGLKKEDLNVILFNSQNITEEALENYRKPTQRRIPVIVYRDIVDLGNISEVQEEYQEIPTNMENHKIRQTRDDFKEIPEAREEKKVNSVNAEGIFAPCEENRVNLFNAEGIFASHHDFKNIMLTPDELKEFPEAREGKMVNLCNVSEIISTREDFNEIPDAREENNDFLFDADENNEDIGLQEETSIVLGTSEKIEEYPAVDEHMKEAFILSLNRIRNIQQSKEMFQERLEHLLRKHTERYKKRKSIYAPNDKIYQFFQQHVVPLCKYHNIPFESYLAKFST